jgi:hypothetical protein
MKTEQEIRDLLNRAARPDSTISREYPLLSIDDASGLLDLLDQARGASGYHVVARAAADLVVTKQRAYGDSFGKSGEVMRLLYPAGVPPEKLDDALTVVRVLDKLFRIATDRDALGESPWRDVLGYALLAVERQARKAALR